VLHAVDPVAWRAPRVWPMPAGPGALVCVYRERRTAVVERLVEDAAAVGLSVALWALDAPSRSPRLAAATIGTGPGPRLALLNRLCATRAASVPGPLVLADDDVEFVRGGLGRLLGAVERCGFGIAQPAHAPGSHRSHSFTASRPLTLARETSFVEVGPLVVVAARWRTRVLPLPEEFAMGWGLDLVWHDLAREGCRLGIVDAVTIRHLAAPASQYERGPEAERLRALLLARNLRSVHALQRRLAAWRVWERRPAWARPEG
jgi:hypothetical protein